MTTIKYDKNIERINKLYFDGFYDMLDISRMMKIHPNKLIEIMLNEKIVFYKRAIGGYSSYKLFNNIDKRLKLIENKLDKIDADIYNKDDDLNFNEDDNFEIDSENNQSAADLEEDPEEKNDIYSKIYDILFMDEDDEEDPEEDEDDEEDPEEEDEDDEENPEEESEEHEDTVSKDVAVQNKKNTYFDYILKKHSVYDFIFGDFVFCSAVLFNISVLVVGFACYCKNLTSPV